MLNKFKSVFKNRCPQCLEGHFFINNNPYVLNQFSKMHANCDKCGLKYEKEPGFYYGAMYINYGLTVFIGLITFAVHYFFFTFNAKVFLINFTVLLFLLIPVMYRTSRLIWINLFVKFKKKA